MRQQMKLSDTLQVHSLSTGMLLSLPLLLRIIVVVVYYWVGTTPEVDEPYIYSPAAGRALAS